MAQGRQPNDPGRAGCPVAPSDGAHRDDVAAHWDDIWRRLDEAQHANSRLKTTVNRLLGDAVSRFCLDFLLRHGIAGQAGSRVLEAGCGSGGVTLELAKRGTHATLLDISKTSIQVSARRFARADTPGAFVQGDLFALPFRDDSFDCVWNAGVIEHFLLDQQRTALSEMVRVCKPGGRIVILVPWRGAALYRLGKRLGERKGEWAPGYEVPLDTLMALWPDRGVSIQFERRYGMLLQLYFLRHLLPARPKFFRYAWRVISEVTNSLFWPLNRLPGFYLTAVAVKNGRAEL
jgi:SAM-dependent methyltransferase